jgi:hypothetical protein
MWIENSFYSMKDNLKEFENSEKIDLYFKSVRDKKILRITFDYQSNYVFQIFHDDMETVGSEPSDLGHLVQDLCGFIGLGSLSTEAEFQEEMEHFENTLKNIEGLSSNKINQLTNVSDDINGLKHAMVMVEDCRLM